MMVSSLTAPTVRIEAPLGSIVLEDNSRVWIDRDCIVGRAPHESKAVRQGHRPVHIEGLTSGMSRVHLEIRRVDDQLFVVDLGSRNGTLLRETRGWTGLAAWQPELWRPGAAVRLGCRTLRFER
jgi:putative drug exporter of the RND superfamily